MLSAQVTLPLAASAAASTTYSALHAEKKRLLSAFYSLESQLVAASQARL
jgi:hypothetical protein